MPPKDKHQQASVPALISPQTAIPLIQRQIQRIADVEGLRFNDPNIDAWESTTRDILNKTFGQPNGEMDVKTHEVMAAFGIGLSIYCNDFELQQDHKVRFAKRRKLLEAYVEQLEDGLAPPVLSTPAYTLHPSIQEVSGNLLRDGHFKQAVLEAFIKVINQVKDKSGLPLDGDALINHAMGCENKEPVLAFNELETTAQRDEQKGIMLLFKGIVGIRNAKAHSNTLFDDPSRAHEYLALASLSMRLLELASVRQPKDAR